MGLFLAMHFGRLLGALTLFGVVQLWQVYLFALLFGCAAASNAAVRQTFVAEMMGDADLPNAVALNQPCITVRAWSDRLGFSA